MSTPIAELQTTTEAHSTKRRISALPGIRWAVLAFSAGVIASLALALAPAPAGASADDFTFDSWNVDAEIGTAADGHATARMTETIVARFPDIDQNRGIVLAKHLEYRGASIDAKDFSVTNGAGTDVPFELEHEDGYVAVLTGTNDYVHGQQKYVISYTLRDIVLPRDDGSADEFYWDLVTPERKQQIRSFSARIAFGGDLAAELNGNRACYRGEANSSNRCELAGNGTAQDPIRIAPLPLSPMQGVTIAIGLKAHAVVQPDARTPNPALDFGPLVLGGAAAATGAVGVVSVLRMRARSRRGRGTVIAQYDVPWNLPPLIAAPVAGASGNAAAAEIVQLAVRNAIRIEQPPAKPGIFGPKEANPVLRLVDPGVAGDPLDAESLASLFPGAAPGAAFEVPAESTKFAEQMDALKRAGVRAAKERGYFTVRRAPAARIVLIVGLVLVVAALALAGFGIATRGSAQAAMGLITAIGGLVLVLISAVKHRVHTPVGAETREYLLGVRLFIEVAEAERIRMLQSARGAERSDVDGVTVIALYEKLLPYAMLFGLEKSWAKVLQTRYESVPGYVPTWYPAAGIAGIAAFGSTIDRFTSTLSSSAAYTSSGSGGSTGGGFVGGGGGGGFAGGR